MSEQQKEQPNNLYPIRGVIYAKPVRTVPKKDAPGENYEFNSVILEVKREYKGKFYIELPEFELGYGVNLNDYEVGDEVVITFSLSGKRVSPTWHKTLAKAIYIKFAEKDGREQTVGGKSASEIRRDIRQQKENDLYNGADPLGGEGPEDDLPF